MKYTNVFISFVYVAAITAANLLVAFFGPWFSPINSLLLIGMDLSLRDKLHEAWNGNNVALKMGSLILLAGAVSYLLNPATGMIAIASVVAFSCAMIVDSLIYQLMIKKPNMIKMNASNAGGAVTDSLLFPTIAFGSFLPEIVALQFSAKVFGGFVWSYIITKFSKGGKQ